jgi:hypothetical protein
MWIAKHFKRHQRLGYAFRGLSQSASASNIVELHKKRESLSMFDEDMIKEDLVLHYNALTDEIGQNLINYSPKITQEYERKYLRPRNVTLEEK